jgi:hypothetical protein
MIFSSFPAYCRALTAAKSQWKGLNAAMIGDGNRGMSPGGSFINQCLDFTQPIQGTHFGMDMQFDSFFITLINALPTFQFVAVIHIEHGFFDKRIEADRAFDLDIITDLNFVVFGCIDMVLMIMYRYDQSNNRDYQSAILLHIHFFNQPLLGYVCFHPSVSHNRIAGVDMLETAFLFCHSCAFSCSLG